MKSNCIFLIFIRVTIQNLWAPIRNRSEIFHFEKSAVFRTLQLLLTTLRKSCGRINARCECNAGRSGDLRSGLTRNYSKKLSSMETTRFYEENQAFLTADFSSVYISAFFIRKRKQRRRSWRNYTQSEHRTAAQGGQ